MTKKKSIRSWFEQEEAWFEVSSPKNVHEPTMVRKTYTMITENNHGVSLKSGALGSQMVIRSFVTVPRFESPTSIRTYFVIFRIDRWIHRCIEI